MENRNYHKRQGKHLSGVNFINILIAAFGCADPESAKKTDNLPVFLVLSGFAGIKFAHNTLMKLTPDVHFFKKLLDIVTRGISTSPNQQYCFVFKEK